MPAKKGSASRDLLTSVTLKCCGMVIDVSVARGPHLISLP
jgi:hypothetical protein